MSFNSRKDFLISCIIAATGTYLNEDYAARDFESVIGRETPEQSICSSFINFIKSMKLEDVEKYASRINFNDYLNSKRGNNTITDRENEIANIIYERIAYNKNNNNAELKEPNNLFKQLAEARKKINLFKTLNDLADNDTFSQDAITWSDKYCEELQNTLNDAISDYSTDVDDKVYFGTDLAAYYEQKIEDRRNGESYSFHNKVLDSLITEGPTPGHGGIIGGSTGMGKSALCLNAVNDLLNADVPVMYFPIEMGLENTLDRLAALRTGYPFKDIVRIGKSGEANNELEEAILYEIKSLATHPNFAIVSDPNIDLKSLRSYIKKFQAKLTGKKYCIVFIDLLLMIKDFYDGGSNMAQMIERAVNKLDILAKELNFHWIGVVQLNRSVESDKVLSEQAIDKLRPTRSSIKNSAALLERARWAITIFRKKYFADLYLSEEESSGIDDIAEIQLMKANDEAIGRRYMTFDGATFKMSWNQDYGKSANGF